MNKSSIRKRDFFFKQIIQSAFSTLVLSCSILLIALILNQTNLLGFLSLGNQFEPFPSQSKDIGFSDAFEYLQEVPFGKVNELEKWKTPIKIKYEGKYNEKDIKALALIAERFNQIKGFPGITFVSNSENVLVTYSSKSEFLNYKEKYKATSDGNSFCIHYSNHGVINKASIVIVNDGLQGYKNSVVLHELFHLIGFFNHSSMRDSILNKQGPVASLSSVDVLAFKMIYNSDIQPKATYRSIVNYYNKSDINSYISASYIASSSNARPLLTLPIVLAAVLLVITFLSSIKKVGFLLSAGKLFVSVIVCVLVFYAYYLMYADIITFMQKL